MTNWTRLAGASLVAVALALPDTVRAQAQRRGGSDSSSSPSSSGSSGGGGGGSDDGGSSAARRAPQSEPSVRTARPRSGSAPAGSATSVQRSSGAAATRSDGAAQSNGGRTSVGRPVQGQAQGRVFRPAGDLPRLTYRGFYSPWYYSGFSHFGYYDPYRYGSSRWARYPYGYGFGLGYGPYGYVPYGPFYDPYFSSYGGMYYGGSNAGRDDERDEDRAMGAIRLRANPREAKVYVDGALVGIVDDFDGFRNHLELEVGLHQLELRADGYDSYTTEISVQYGKTITERANLNKR